jgi:hypothetical protein
VRDDGKFLNQPDPTDLQFDEAFTQTRLKLGGAMPKPSKSGSSITATPNSVRTDRATLFYRVRGSGALLLILPGGDGDADIADALCDELIDRYTNRRTRR